MICLDTRKWVLLSKKSEILFSLSLALSSLQFFSSSVFFLLFYLTMINNFKQRKNNYNIIYIVFFFIVYPLIFYFIISGEEEYFFNKIIKLSPIFLAPLFIYSSKKLDLNFIIKCLSYFFLILMGYFLINNLFNYFFGLGQVYYHDFLLFKDAHATYFSMYLISVLILERNTQSLHFFLRALLYLASVVTFYFLDVYIVFVFILVFVILTNVSPINKFRIVLSSLLIFLTSIILLGNIYADKQVLLIGNEKENGITQRFWLWSKGAQLIVQSPLVGNGHGKESLIIFNESHLIRNQTSFAYTKSSWINSTKNFHNQYLDYAVKYGLFSALIFIIYLAFLFKETLFRFDSLLFSNIILIFIVFMLTENVLDRQPGIYFLALYLSLFINVAYINE